MLQFQNFSAIQILREINLGLELDSRSVKISESLLRAILREINFIIFRTSNQLKRVHLLVIEVEHPIFGIIEQDQTLVSRTLNKLEHFLPFRLYVKLILGILEVQNMPF